jgi:short-subunit dehydrogenase
MSDVVIITGGGSGIGQQLAISFSAKGKKVLIIGRTKSKLIKTQNKNHQLIDYIQGDITVSKTRHQIAEYLKNNNLKIKYLIHCAAIITPIKPIFQISQKEWNKLQDINVTSPMILTTDLKEYFNLNSRVLFISSGWAHFAEKNFAAYCVSKAALLMLFECFKVEMPKVHFGILDPGVVDTDMIKIVKQHQANEEEFKVLENLKSAKNPSKVADPIKIADHISWILEHTSNEDFSSEEWLASNSPSYRTNEIYYEDEDLIEELEEEHTGYYH